jgi:transmembrane sensor
MTEIELRIVDLIERHLKDELSDAEKQELESWKNQSPGNQRIFDDLYNNAYLKGSITESYNADRKERVHATIHKRIEDDQTDRLKSRTITLRLLIAAATIIGLIAGIAYFWPHNNNEKQVATTGSHSDSFDKEPKNNGAILKLSNGKEIVLDNIADGKLEQQGNSTINKKGNVLAYNSNGATGETLQNTLITPVGRQFQLVLPDGTRVWLNSSSSMTYPTSFAGGSRDVTVTGEVYMEVTRDTKRPFSVHITPPINGMEETVVRVLGTHFNINAYGDETPVLATLLEGSVKVTTGNKTALLKPGQQALVETRKISVQSGVDLDKEVAWKNGYFEFNDDPLQTVMKELARWYGVTVLYAPAFKVPDDTFNGRIPRSSNLADVLNVLEKNEVHFKVEGKKIIVSP